MNAKKILKITAITLASVICLFVMIAGGYVAYVAAQYYRIEDNLKLGVSDGATRSAAAGETFTVMTYNLGFGAYSPEYSFFMDTGVMKDGTEVTGKYAKGTSREDVRKNVDGQLSVAKAAAADFYFFQEVDESADRSYKIDMKYTRRTFIRRGCFIRFPTR